MALFETKTKNECYCFLCKTIIPPSSNLWKNVNFVICSKCWIDRKHLHELIESDRPTKWICDKCNINFNPQQIVRYRCEVGCDYDLCALCYRKTYPIQMPKRMLSMHKHNTYYKEEGCYRCDVCKIMNPTQNRWRCESCDWNACEYCVIYEPVPTDFSGLTRIISSHPHYLKQVSATGGKPGYAYGFVCDACAQSSPSHTRWWCEICNFDLCEKCMCDELTHKIDTDTEESIELEAYRLKSSFDKLQTPLKIIVALDGINIFNDQWQTMKTFVSKIPFLLSFNMYSKPSSVQMKIIQFSYKVSVISEFSDNPYELSEVVNKTNKLGYTTQMGDDIMLMGLKNMIKENIYHKCLMIVTPREFDSDTSILTNDGWSVFIVGVGLLPSTAQKSRLSVPPECFFSVLNIDHLLGIMNLIPQRPLHPPKISLCSIGSEKAIFKIEAPYKFKKCTIQCNSPSEKKSVTTEGNTCCIIGLTPNQMYTASGICVDEYSNTKSEASSIVNLRTLRKNPETQIFKSENLPNIVKELTIKFNNFKMKSIHEKIGVESLNILLMGRVGNGKSSFLNTVVSILNGNYIQKEITRQDIKTVTLNLKKHTVNKLETLNIWDMYGWRDSNLPQREFDALISGSLPNRYKEGTDLDKYLFPKDIHLESKVHSVIIICESNTVFINSELLRVKEFYSRLIAKDIKPVIVISKIDTIQNSTVSNGYYEDVFECGHIEACLNWFCNNTSIPREYVYPAVNYTGPNQYPNRKLEKLILNILEVGIQQAQMFIDTISKNFIRVVDIDTYENYGVILCDKGFEVAVIEVLPKIKNLLTKDFNFSIVLKNSKLVEKYNIITTKLLDCLIRKIDNLPVLYIKTSAILQKVFSKLTVYNGNKNCSIGFIKNINSNTTLNLIRETIVNEKIHNTTDFVFFLNDWTFIDKKKEHTIQIQSCILDIINNKPGFVVKTLK